MSPPAPLALPPCWPDVLDRFRADISKDEHFRGREEGSGRGIFVKQVRDPANGRREFEALRCLAAAPGETLVPRPLDLTDSELHLELVEGIRLYDLLRLLRQIGDGEPQLGPVAGDVARRLLGRARRRAERMQALLGEAAGSLSTGPYPCAIKVEGMFSLLSELFGLPPLDDAMRVELDAFRERWDAAVSVPFRDATPKNIIVAVEALAVGRHPGEAARRAALARLLADGDEAFWREVPLFDIDFASVEHLTVPEDDMVSLLGHEASFRALTEVGAADAAPVAGELAEIARRNPPRAALAFFVRYLRFAGRKVAYRVVNPVGGATRFRHDRFGFYFQALPRLLAALDPTLVAALPATLARWSAIGTAALPFDRAGGGGRDAYLAFVGRPVDYWQESPLELAARPRRAARP
ncbi:hypothetical protein [Ancylobacter sp. IITR112]|uniref:hypothetical protein n=1 Tax=Ancylobacter sp. IITR112 TaxID=3138073 RepID=UPI00352B3CA1